MNKIKCTPLIWTLFLVLKRWVLLPAWKNRVEFNLNFFRVAEIISVHDIFSLGLSLDFSCMYWTCNSMNNLSSFCGLTASDTDSPTDKRTDVPRFHNMKNQLWAVVWAGLWNKRFWLIMSNFWGWCFQLFVSNKKKW